MNNYLLASNWNATNTSYALDTKVNSVGNWTADKSSYMTYANWNATNTSYATWTNVMNGTLAKTSDLVNYNSSSLIKDWNSSGLIKDFNASGLIKNWTIDTSAYTTWSQATNGTLAKTGAVNTFSADQVFSNSINLTDTKKINFGTSKYINSNSTCVIIKGATSQLEIC